MTVQQFIEEYHAIEAGSRVREREVCLVGRIHSKREASKKLAFLDLTEGGARVQVLAEEKEYEVVPDVEGTASQHFRGTHRVLRRGDYIHVRGFPGKSDKGELSLVPRCIAVLAPAAHDIPPELSDPDLRHRSRHLDLLVNRATSRRPFLVRAAVIRTLRRYLDAAGFVEVETPVLAAAAGGATAKPFRTECEAMGHDLALRIAPELYLKQLVVGGFERVYEVGKVFRNEGIDSQHNPEFTTCEFYEAHADCEALMVRTEVLLRDMAAAAAAVPREDITAASVESSCSGPDPAGGSKPAPVLLPIGFMSTGARAKAAAEGAVLDGDLVAVDLAAPFRRIEVVAGLEERLGEPLGDVNGDEASVHLLDVCRRHGVDASPPHTAARLLDALVGHFLEPECVQPTFLVNHPTCLSPLAREHRSKPGLTERFELFVGGRELVNAYTELNDPDEQRSRFAAQSKNRDAGDEEVPPTDEAFCRALEYGMPPTAGWGMGIDRVAMLLSGTTHIREVILFPMMKSASDSAAE